MRWKLGDRLPAPICMPALLQEGSSRILSSFALPSDRNLSRDPLCLLPPLASRDRELGSPLPLLGTDRNSLLPASLSLPPTSDRQTAAYLNLVFQTFRFQFAHLHTHHTPLPAFLPACSTLPSLSGAKFLSERRKERSWDIFVAAHAFFQAFLFLALLALLAFGRHGGGIPSLFPDLTKPETNIHAMPCITILPSKQRWRTLFAFFCSLFWTVVVEKTRQGQMTGLDYYHALYLCSPLPLCRAGQTGTDRQTGRLCQTPAPLPAGCFVVRSFTMPPPLPAGFPDKRTLPTPARFALHLLHPIFLPVFPFPPTPQLPACLPYLAALPPLSHLVPPTPKHAMAFWQLILPAPCRRFLCLDFPTYLTLLPAHPNTAALPLPRLQDRQVTHCPNRCHTMPACLTCRWRHVPATCQALFLGHACWGGGGRRMPHHCAYPTCCYH